MSTEQLLNERQKTHGEFAGNAMVSQRLKQVLRAECQGYEMMHVVYKEVLDMICVKLSRICSGQPGFKDHWDDIAGYARLASEHIEKLPTIGTTPGGISYGPPSR